MGHQRRILVLGMDPAGKGGISTVSNVIAEAFDADPDYAVDLWTSRSARPLLRDVVAFPFLLVKLILRHRSYDAFHLQLAFKGSLWRKAVIAACLTVLKREYIVHAHGSMFFAYHGDKSSLGHFVARKVLRNAAKLIVLSKDQARRYGDCFDLPPSQMEVLYNPAPDAASLENGEGRSLLERDSRVRLVFTGRLIRRKGVHRLLTGLAALVRAHPQYLESLEMIFVGDGDIAGWQAFADGLGISPFVSFLGWQPRAQTLIEVAQADIFVLASENEGLPMSVLEAMSLSRAIVVTRVPGLEEVLPQDAASYIPLDFTDDGIGSALHALISRHALRDLLGKNAFRASQLIGPQAYHMHLKRIYDTVIARENRIRRPA